MRKVRSSVVLDTNVLIFDTFEDSLYHSEASAMLDALERWVLCRVVIYEYIWFMKRLNVESAVVLEKVEEYVLDPKASIYQEEARVILRALRRICEEDIALSRFNDKLILSAAEELGLPLASFDEKLRKQARRAGIPVLPPKLPAGKR